MGIKQDWADRILVPVMTGEPVSVACGCARGSREILRREIIVTDVVETEVGRSIDQCEAPFPIRHAILSGSRE